MLYSFPFPKPGSLHFIEGGTLRHKVATDSAKNKPLNSLPDTIYCPLPRRLLAMLYDTVIMLGLLILASAVALPFGNVNKVAFQDFWFTLWLLLVCFAYYGSCWRYGGMTVGMRAWHLRLVRSDGQAISWPGCCLRFLVGLVSLAVFGLGVLWALVDQKSRCWHDLVQGTLLIRLHETSN